MSEESVGPVGAPEFWPALAYEDVRPGLPQRGVVWVGPKSLAFQAHREGKADPSDRSLPFEGLVCRVDGVQNDTVHLSHPGHPGFEVVVQGHEVLRQTSLADLEVVQQARRGALRVTQRFWAVRIAGSCLALLALLVGVVAAIWAGRWLLERLLGG